MKNILVSIGVPVFNGEKFIGKTLDSLINQTHKNIEIIISDNCSNDKTVKICKNYCELDSRIKLFRHDKKIDVAKNFYFVFKKSKGIFFTWNAVNDFKSHNFVEVNLAFLLTNKNYVASTSINFFGLKKNNFDFGLEGELEQRIKTFFDNCWFSHGIFYSLIKTSKLKKCPYLGELFFAFDWAINIFILENGPIKRLKKGSIMIDDKGISNSYDLKKTFVNSFLDRIFPFRKLLFYTLKGINKCSFSFKIKIVKKIIYMNFILAKHIMFMTISELKRNK